MPTTMNGWRQVDKAAVVRIPAGEDHNGVEVLRGGVAAAFAWLVTQFHTRVEPIRIANGHRTAKQNKDAGGAARSNHISGTAIDLNGDVHLFERKNPAKPYRSGFTAAQERTVRAILAEAGGLFRWGLDFPRGLRDAMHFELAKGTTAPQVAAFVRRTPTLSRSEGIPVRPDPRPTPVPKEDDDMPTLDEIARAVWGYKNKDLERVDAYALLRRTNANAQASAKGVVDVKALAESIAAAIAQAMPSGTLTPAQVNRVARVAAKDVLKAS